jgi:hypothetical protein
VLLRLLSISTLTYEEQLGLAPGLKAAFLGFRRGRAFGTSLSSLPDPVWYALMLPPDGTSGLLTLPRTYQLDDRQLLRRPSHFDLPSIFAYLPPPFSCLAPKWQLINKKHNINCSALGIPAWVGKGKNESVETEG